MHQEFKGMEYLSEFFSDQNNPKIPNRIRMVEIISACVNARPNAWYSEFTLILSMRKRSIPLKIRYNDHMIPGVLILFLNAHKRAKMNRPIITS
jgi:hypothetical protein